VARSALDNSLAAERLGWAPAVSLEDGLARTLESFRIPSP
jgi:nucleoside-diphosphate-sugar epimerase